MTQQPFIDNKYTALYYKLVAHANKRVDRTGTIGHHVIPESFYKQRSRKGPAGWIDGNPDDPSNIAYFTEREHLIAHRLLKRMTSGRAKQKMSMALWVMLNTMMANGTVRKVKNSREYQELREVMAAENKALCSTPEWKAAMAAGRNRPGYKEQFMGDKNCMKRPEIRKNWEEAMEATRDKYLAAVQSDEHRQNLREIMTIKMNDPEVNDRLRAALAKPSTKALKSANMTGAKNPMYDGRVFVCVNEDKERVEFGTLTQLAQRLELKDYRSLKRTIESGIPTRWGWRIVL